MVRWSVRKGECVTANESRMNGGKSLAKQEQTGKKKEEMDGSKIIFQCHFTLVCVICVCGFRLNMCKYVVLLYN